MRSEHLFCFLLLLTMSTLGSSQSRSFRDFIIAANSPTNPKASETNFKTAGGKERFELENWAPGWALSRGDELVKEGYAFNFDYEQNDLYLRKDDDDQMIIVDKNSIRRLVIFNGSDSIRFVKSIAVDKTNKILFQLLGGNATGKIALLKLRTAKLIPVNKNDYASNFNGDYTPHYRNKTMYYFVDAEIGVKEFEKITRDELLKLYPQHQALIVKYFPTKKAIDEKTLSLMVTEINSL